MLVILKLEFLYFCWQKGVCVSCRPLQPRKPILVFIVNQGWGYLPASPPMVTVGKAREWHFVVLNARLCPPVLKQALAAHCQFLLSWFLSLKPEEWNAQWKARVKGVRFTEIGRKENSCQGERGPDSRLSLECASIGVYIALGSAIGSKFMLIRSWKAPTLLISPWVWTFRSAPSSFTHGSRRLRSVDHGCLGFWATVLSAQASALAQAKLPLCDTSLCFV